MAKLEFTIVANDQASDKVDKLNSKLNNLTKETIKIKVEAVGVDNVTKSAIQLANAQARLAKAEADAAKEAEKKAAADARAKTATENRIAAEKRLQTQIERNKSIDKELELQQERTSQSANKAAAEIAKTGRANQDLAMQQERSKQSSTQLAIAQEKTAQSANRLASEQEKTSRAHQKAEQSANQLNAAYSKLGMTMMNFAKYKFFQAIENGVSDSVAEMKALDDELVTVRKVANATDAELAALSDRSFEVGSKYGRSASDYAAGVAEFNRAGYRETAEDLAELSIKTQLVGDMSAATANQFLLATDAAYQYNGSVTKLTAALDGMNAIDNNYATSIEKIAAGLGKVAPIASQAHVGLDELAAALGTITAVTQRSGEEASTALRALFLNIMGDTKTEIEDGATWTAGEIEGLRDIMRQYIPEIVNEAERLGTVINPMEAIGALAKAYQDGIINEEALMQQVTDIGGKLRSSQLLSIIKNWDMYESMLNTYRSAAGSADAEISKMMDSWSVKSKQLSTSFTKLMSNFMNADIAKGGLDALIGIVEVLDSDFGRAAISAGLLAAGFAGLYKAGSSLVGVFANLGKMSTGGWISLAIAGAGVLYGVIDQIIVDYDELVAKAEESQQVYQQEKNELEAVNAELETTNARIEELQAKGSLSLVEQEELDRLTAMTAELEKQQEIREKEAKEAQRQYAFDSTSSMTGYRPGKGYSILNPPGYTDFSEDNYAGLSKKPLAFLLNQERDINSLVAAYDKANELAQEGKLEGIEYNDVLFQISETAKKNAKEIDNYLSANEEYYTDLISGKKMSEMNSYELEVVSTYKQLVKAQKEYKEFFDPESFSRENINTLEAARTYVDEYTSSLKSGSEYAINFSEAQKELYDNLSDIQGPESALKFVEKLGKTYGLSREGVNALYQDARYYASKINGLESTFFDSSEANEQIADDSEPKQELQNYKKLSDAIQETQTKFLTLRQAMGELNDTGRVTGATLRELEHFGIDLGNVLYDDLTGGFIVSEEAIREAGKAAAEFLNETTGADYTFDPDTSGVDAFTESLNEASSALSDLQKQMNESSESGDTFREAAGVYETAMGLYEEGRFNTKSYALATDFLLSDDALASAGNDAKARGDFLGNEFFSGFIEAGNQGGSELAEFLVENFEKVGGEGASFFKDLNGQIQVTTYDLEAMSRSTGISTELWSAALGLIDEYSNKLSVVGDNADFATKNFDKFADVAKNVSAGAAKFGEAVGEDSNEAVVSVDAETEDAEEKIDSLTDKVTAINGDFAMSFMAHTEESEEKLGQLLAMVESVAGQHTISFNVSVGGYKTGLGSRGLPAVNLPAFAEGTEAAKDGPAIVNEKGPELIVSKGRAFIADDGKPTIVDLDAGDIVYTNEETNELLSGKNIGNGIPSHEAGTSKAVAFGAKAISAIGSFFSTSVPGGSSSGSKNKKAKKPSNEGGSSSVETSSSTGGSDDSGSKETDWWKIVEDYFSHFSNQQQRAIDRLDYQIELLENDLEDLSKPIEKEVDQLERLNDQLDRQVELLQRQAENAVEPLQDQVNELRKAKEIQDDQLELAERQKAVEEARNELQNAQNERTIRYYNAQKGQWEWMADRGRVADAEEALKDAEKDLADYEYEMRIKALESQIEQIEGVYQDRIDEIEDSQLVNDDRIYDLEQQLLALEDAYNSAIEPYEAKMTELERQLKAIEEQWAEAEMPYDNPEGDLAQALANIQGSAAEKAAVANAVNELKDAASFNLSSVGKAVDKTVSVSPTQTTNEQYNAIMSDMGIMFGAGSKANSSNSYTNSNTSTIYDYSGAINIAGINVNADPKTTTLADLLEDVGIYTQR